MRISKKMVVILCLFYLLAVAIPVFAQEEPPPPPEPCVGPDVSGTVVAVDAEAMVVTLELADGSFCTVVLDEGEYDHPVIALLGTYFDDLSVEDLSNTLQALNGCVLVDEVEGTWVWVDCLTPGAVPVTITGVDDAGEFTGTLATGEEGVVQVDDPIASGELLDTLEALVVSWQLDEAGSVVEAGDQIAAYHAEGIGFGVLVKLYAMAGEAQEACLELGAADDPACGITVEELVSQIQNEGLGMGDLFELYGKPAMLGVGHVRQGLREGKGKPPWAGPKDKTEDVADPEDEDPLEASEAQAEDGHGPPDHANGNSNKDKDKDKGKDKGQRGRPAHAGPPNGRGKK